MSSTHIDYLELTKYTGNPETPSSAQRMLAAVNATLVYWDGSSWSVLGSGGGGGSTWEQLYANDNTFNITSGNGWTIADTSASANATLTLTKDAGSSGHAIQITQSGSGKDINGTSDTWSVTKAGLGTFAGISISGTSTAIATTDDATWEIKDNDATSLRIGPSGGPVFLTFDTRNSAEVLSTDALTFQVTSGKTNLIQASNTISALVVTDNTVTTFGADANSAGVAVIRSTSLTTGSLLQLQLTEGTLNGGFYLTARDVTGSANVLTIGEDGATTIAGAGGNTVFTITAGDAIMSDGSLAITDADNAASFSVTNNTATTASVVVIAGSGVFTGSTTTSFMTITPSGLTTGTAVYLVATALTTGIALDISTDSLTTGKVIDMSDLAAITTGKAIHIDATGVTQTDGILVHVDSASTALTSTGRLLLVDHTGASTASGAGILVEFKSAAADGTTMVKLTNAAAITGIGLDISLVAMTTGTAIDIGNLDALTTGKGINLVSNSSDTGAFILLNVKNDHASATGAIAASFANDSTGTTVFIDHNGATGKSLYIDAESTTQTGGVVDIAATVLTTGTAIDIGDLDALTTGIGINVVSNSADTGAFFLLKLVNDNALATGAVALQAQNDSTGNTIVIDHNGITGKALYIDAESTTQTGGIVDIDVNTLTTGTAIDMGNADALTSGKVINIVMNSADTGAYRGIYVKADNASATGAVPLELVQDSSGACIVTTSAATSTNFFKVGTFNGVTLWVGNGNTGNTALSGTAGDILFNGGSNKPEYCTGTTNWTALV